MPKELELLTQGAEGRIYTSKWLGRDVIIKQRFKKGYRHPELDSHITKERMKAEAKSLVRCRMIGVNVPALYDVNFYANELVLENISGSIPVRRYVNDRSTDSPLLPPLAEEIGQILSKLHLNDIIHGDLTTSNMLIVEPSDKPLVYLIDFGLSYVSEQAEDKAVDLYVLERAVLSTHPNSDDFMKRILETYKRAGDKKAGDVISRLDDVRMRGRKKLSFG